MSIHRLENFDRHALVLMLWLSFGFVAATLFHTGFGMNDPWWIVAGFAVVVLGFVGHVLVHVNFGSRFTPGEVAFGLVTYAVGILAFVLSLLFADNLNNAIVVAASLGFVVTAAAVVFAMIIWLGVRGAFESFDVIRRFNVR